MTTPRHTLLRSRLTALGLALILLPPSVAGALDDGGGRSVFAIGAGNRALGMGGAYCAIADDASGAIWNPGGLGWVERRQLALTQTSLYGLGFSEQYAGLVMPHHRYGTFAAVLRRFAVEGIEGRDDRGALLDDDLSDNELEIAFAYGRAVGPHLTCGASVKLQRQDLAGYSDGAIGLDLGLLARPLGMISDGSHDGGLTFGLAIRNAVAPRMRLDQDHVPDPTAVRAGLAWQRHLTSSVALLTSIDVERTRGMDRRLHAGAEASLFDVIALRAGSFAGCLTAGAGIRWQGVAVDYQYEDNQLGGISRLGVGLAFGPTIDESRQLAQARAAAAMQQRMDELLARRSREQAGELAVGAREALADGEWERALDLAGTLAVFQPDHAELVGLQVAAWRGKAAADKAAGDAASGIVCLSRALALAPADSVLSRELAEARRDDAERSERSQRARAAFDAAIDAFARDDLATAGEGFAAILAANPDDPAAGAMLSRTRDACDRRVGQLLADGLSDLAAGRTEAVAARLDEMRRLAPRSPAIAELEAQLAKRRAAPVPASRPEGSRAMATYAAPAPVAAAPAPQPARTAAEERELAALFARGVAAIDAGRHQDAVRYWELVWSAAPDYGNVAGHLAREYLAMGMEEYAGGNLNRAIENWQRALTLAPDDARARGYLARARDQLNRMQNLEASRR